MKEIHFLVFLLAMNSKLIRITSNYFCAGIIIENGKVIKTAPILYKRLFSLTEEKCKEVCRQNRWNYEELKKETL